MVAIQGGHPSFKGNSPHLRPQLSWTESSPTRSKVLPLRHGGLGPTRHASWPRTEGAKTAARGARNCPVVTSIPPLSLGPAGERADRHAGGMQPHQGAHPFDFDASSMEAQAHTSCNRRAGYYVRATTPPPAPLPRLLDCGTRTATRGNPAVPAKRDGQTRSKMGRQ